ARRLAHAGIHLLDYGDRQPTERTQVETWFTDSVLPLLMPLGFDAARPFPHISSRATALAVVVRSAGREHFACLQMPEAIPALVPFHWRRTGVEDAPRLGALEQGFVW